MLPEIQREYVMRDLSFLIHCYSINMNRLRERQSQRTRSEIKYLTYMRMLFFRIFRKQQLIWWTFFTPYNIYTTH